MLYSGASKVEFCRDLGESWRELADYLEIPPHEKARFKRGDEARGIWEWLEARGFSGKLSEALRFIRRGDLADRLILWQQDGADGYYRRRIAQCSDSRYALDKRFVQLTLLLDQGEEAEGPRWAAQARRFQELGDLLAHVPDQALVLLGAPGSGKSTLLRHFELDNASGLLDGDRKAELAEAPLTFFVQLNGYKGCQAGDPPPLPKHWLMERWAAMYPELPALEALLRERRLTLLLDALNEIPYAGDEPVRMWKDFLRELTEQYPGNRVIFSCRSLDYSAPLSTPELPVPQMRIEPLSDEQVQRFIELYYPAHGARLWKSLAGSPQLELLRSPYYLKLLVEQTTEGEIPSGRAALFTGFVRQALRREVSAEHPLFRPGELLTERDRQRLTQARRWKTPWELPTRGILLGSLSRLAHEMQARRAEHEASQVRVDYDDALDLLDHARAEDILEAGESLGVLEEDLGRDEVLFVHQLLQEYFAARQFAAAPAPERVQSAWGADAVSPGLKETLGKIADADPLPLLPSTGWEETSVLAAAMTDDPDRFVVDLMHANLPLAGRCAAQPDVAISADLETQLRAALIARTEDPRADLRARIAAGLTLGALGDPRFERHRGEHGNYLLPPLVEISGGTYPVGSDEGLYDREAPAHEVALQPFLIARFPVTNAEWALFIEAGGYEDARWWVSEEDQAWRRGESTAEGPKRSSRDFRQTLQNSFDQIRIAHEQGRITSKQADDWEQIARMDDAEFETLLDGWYPSGRQTRPAYWDDEGFNNPAQPVVGICWHEARAYCAWLSAQSGRTFRLPSEAEWEAAARGRKGRRFAYGDSFDPQRGNGFETHIRRTTPIGIFPGGETPEGLVDMTGNTWDWTISLFRPYPYDPGDGREELLSGDGRRVLRGGSWDYGQDDVRCACRGHDRPAARSNDTGVRLVCSPPIV